MKTCPDCNRGSFTLEYALFTGAAVLTAVVAVPLFLRLVGGYLAGFQE